MSGSLSCPKCGAAGIALGATGCPACGVPFVQTASPVVPVASAAAIGAPIPAVAHGGASASATGHGYHAPMAAAPTPDVVTYAGMGARFVAGLLDSIILAVPIGLIFGWGSTSGTGGFSLSTDFTTPDAVEILASWLYFACLQSGAWQATVGMRVMGLRVVREDDLQPISFGRATGRNFAAYLSAIILLIGYIMMAFTKKHQALHDIISGTVVVKRAD